GRLGDAVRAFETLTQEDPKDAAAWYNLGLARAWLGDNMRSLEALDRHVELEPDAEKAGAAWSLGEVLRFGSGMMDVSDHHEYGVAYQVRDVNQVAGLLQEWDQARRLVPLPSNQEEGYLNVLVLEGSGSLIVGASAAKPSKVAAYLLIYRQFLRIWGPNK